jgi:hypothetical protein
MGHEWASEEAHQATAEWHSFLNDAAASYGALGAGLGFLRRQFEEFARVARLGPDEVVHITTGDGAPNRPSDAFAIWTPRTIRERCTREGLVARQLGHWWVSHVYATWEHGFRPRLAKAQGLQTDELQERVMGDLRRIRHDVLHHQGVATAQWSGRCQRLRWFGAGDEIFVSERMVYEFMDQFGLAEPAPSSSS